MAATFLVLGMTPSCVGVRISRAADEGAFRELTPRCFRFEDDLVRLDLIVGRTSFRWEFRNKLHRTMRIEYRHLQLLVRRGGVTERLTLWGQQLSRVSDRVQSMPDIEVPAHRFFGVTYPLQVRSPAYPFSPDDAALDLTVAWGQHAHRYQLQFRVDDVESM